MEGREFVRLLALMLRAEIDAEIRERGMDARFTVEGTLANLNSMVAFTKGEWSRLDNVTRAHRTVFESCGFEVPKIVIRGVTAFDYPMDGEAGEPEFRPRAELPTLQNLGSKEMCRIHMNVIILDIISYLRVIIKGGTCQIFVLWEANYYFNWGPGIRVKILESMH